MRQTKQGIGSTKHKEIIEECLPVIPLPKRRDVTVKTLEMRDLIAMDPTRKSPIMSSKGSKYIMVMCEIDGNATQQAMKKRTEGEMIKSYLALIQQLKHVGIKTKHQILDNKASDEYQQTIKNSGATYQLVPLDMDWKNIAEKAMQAF